MNWAELSAALLVGLVGGALTGFISGRAALTSWKRSRQDIADKQAVELIQQLSTDLAGLSHCAMWLTWKAKFDPDSLQPGDVIARYENDTYEKVPRLLGNLAALAAINMEAATSLHSFVKEICVLDGRIALAAIGARDEDVAGLAALYETSKESYEELLTTLNCRAARVLGKQSNFS